ncbi:mersacidin/lichenicidin family type 2 lantibiotic [Nannocystaceae bacterium ST9]
MDNATIVRAWKDPMFRATLTPEQLASLPPNPAGPAYTELGDAELVNWTLAVTCCWPALDGSGTHP